MREAAEAGDDVSMLDGILHALLAAQGREQRAGQFLVGQRLAVLERHVEEEPDIAAEGHGIEAGKRLPRGPSRLLVAAEGAGGAAEGVARELVAEKDQRQRALRRLYP